MEIERSPVPVWLVLLDSLVIGAQDREQSTPGRGVWFGGFIRLGVAAECNMHRQRLPPGPLATGRTGTPFPAVGKGTAVRWCCGDHRGLRGGVGR